MSAILDLVTHFIKEHNHLTTSAGTGINTNTIDQRQSLINSAGAMSNALTDCVERVNSLANMAKRLQDEEIAALGVIIDNVRGGKTKRATLPVVDVISTSIVKSASTQRVAVNAVNAGAVNSAVSTVNAATLPRVQPQRPAGSVKPPQGWTLVQRKTNPADVVKSERVPIRTLPAVGGGLERVHVTSSICINAIPVKAFSDVKCDGNLYYVSTCAHFAISINGMLFHGNIGTIYTDADEPKKIKDCKYVDGCNKEGQCCYYHNPKIFPGSTDRRNYIASSFVYTNPAALYKNRSRSRRFGSLDNLDSDILGLTEEEKSRMCDQAMHDLLCAVILKNLSRPTSF